MEWNKLRDRSRILLKPLVRILSPVPPNVLTFSGLVIVIIASIFIVFGRFRPGGSILLLGTLIDSIDGEIARRTERTSTFGAFLDSTLDRYSDYFIFISIAFAGRLSLLAPLSLLALLGSFLTSYVRARSDSLGYEVSEGFITRTERIAIIIIGLLIGENYLIYFIIALAAGTNITAVQRIVVAYKRMKYGGS